jgi:hypothetical protein
MVVKINSELVDDMLKFQAVYEVYIDFDATYEELRKLGYCPIRYSAGRIQRVDAGNLTFMLKSGAKVNVFPKGQPHKIQVTWNIREEKEKQFCELTSVLVPSTGERLVILPVRSATDDRDEFLDELFNEGLI